MSQQKPRRIGMGMKPRSPEESGSMSENPEVLPTTEGQETVPLQGPNEVADVAVEGGGLESVVAELFPAAAESESEVETSGPEVKTGEVSDVASNAFSDPLADVLKASGEVQNLESLEIDQLAEKVTPELMEGVNDPLVDVGQEFPVTSKDGNTTVYKIPYSPRPPKAEDFVITKSGRKALAEAGLDSEKKYFIGTDFGSGPDKTVVAVIEKGTSEAPDKLVGIFDIKLGELDSGEYRHTVRIAEAYVEGAKQQAAADNQNLEDWLSGQLNFFLEQWFFSSGQK